MAAIYKQRLIVAADQIDGNGHVNNVVYVAWMQELANAHSAARGWDEQRYRRTGVAWVARRHTIDYLKPALLGDELLLRTWVVDMDRIRCRRRYRFERPADGVLLARAETEWVFVRRDSGRPCSILPEVSADFVLAGEEPQGQQGED